MREYIYGKLDRGPIEFGSRMAEKEREIMKIARKNVICVPPTMPIKGVAETMVEYDTRRLPIVQPGNNKIQGIVITRDIIDFLGGGEKFNLIKNKHKGNFLSAINESVREIMTHEVIHIKDNDSVGNALKTMYKKNVGGFPILNKQNIVVGIVEEEDFVYNLAGIWSGVSVEEIMNRDIVTMTPGFSIGDTCRLMIKNYLRRIPIVSDDELIGIVSTFDIIRYFGTSRMFDRMRTENVDEALNVRINEIMSIDFQTIRPSDDVGKAIESMRISGMGLLPVVEDDRLVGVLTERDILMNLMKEEI